MKSWPLIESEIFYQGMIYSFDRVRNNSQGNREYGYRYRLIDRFEGEKKGDFLLKYLNNIPLRE